MKAMVYTRYGNADGMRMEEVEKPVPKNREVLIQVHAASVNSWDRDLLRGQPFLARLGGGGLRKPHYRILGCGVAGRVVAVGRKVKQFAPGDEVFGDISGCGWGAFAEYTAAHENMLIRKPPGMAFEEAAAIPQAAVLALQGLRKGRIRKGQKVLVNGAGGGAGTFAAQLAKRFGAEVTAVDGKPKRDMLKSIGADDVMDDGFHDQAQKYRPPDT